MRIGERVRQIREARGMHMTIAHEIRSRYGVKIDPSYLSRMERGKAEIPLRTLFAIADYFDVHPGHLIDPTSSGNVAGIDFIFTDPELVENIIRLKNGIGEVNTRYHIKLFARQILYLMSNTAPRNREAEEEAGTT